MDFDDEIINDSWQELPPTIDAISTKKINPSKNGYYRKLILGLLFLLLIIWFIFYLFSCSGSLMAPSNKITGYPNIFHSGVEYIISSEHINCHGKDKITLCQLKLIHPEQTLVLSWDMENPDKIIYKNLSNKYIRIKKIEYKTLKNGYKVFWHFVLKSNWKECNNINFAANVKEKSGNEYGWNDILETNVHFVRN